MPAGVKKRRHAREWAVQMLFQLDMNPRDSVDAVFDAFWLQLAARNRDEEIDANRLDVEAAHLPLSPTEVNAAAPPKLRAFAESLVRGVMDNLAAIDGKLSQYTRNWPLHRMGGVDRNVLRLGIYELFFCEGVPVPVCINEAVDLAKFFGNRESGRFVNGILDRAGREVGNK